MKDILTAPFVKEMCDTTANISVICLMKMKLHNILTLTM